MKLKKYTYCQIPSRERKRLHGFKKVNELKDGFLILIEVIKSFFILFINNFTKTK